MKDKAVRACQYAAAFSIRLQTGFYSGIKNMTAKHVSNCKNIANEQTLEYNIYQ
jgi:hypothetical protein